jgi:predicted transcriptional regulator
VSIKGFAKELGLNRQDLSAYLHQYERLVSRIPKNTDGSRDLSPEVMQFVARAHQIVMQEQVSVQDAMKRLLKLERSSGLKQLAGAVERSAGLKEVVKDLEDARGAAERLRDTTRVVRVDELKNIQTALEQVTTRLDAMRADLWWYMLAAGVVGMLLGAGLVLFFRR